jgi:hypothetical protein
MASSSSSSVSIKETWEPLMGPKLTGGERRWLMQFLRAYMSCFAFSMKELGVLIGLGIQIELAIDTPIFRRPYRYSDMERDLIWSQTLDLLEVGLVELSHGEYDAPPSSLCDPKRVQRVGFAEMVRNLVLFPASNTKRGRGVMLEAPGLD